MANEETTISTMDEGSDSSTESHDDNGTEFNADGSPAGAQNTDTSADDNAPEGETADEKIARLAAAGDGDGEGEETPEQKQIRETAEAEEEVFNTRFDNHPRFKQLITDQQDSKKALQTKDGEIARLHEQITSLRPERDYDKELSDLATDLDAGDIDISEFTKKSQEISQAQVDDAADLRETTERTANEQKVSQAQLLEDNPFIEKVLAERPDEVEAMKKTNPLHDDLSATLAIHIADLVATKQTDIDAAVKTAVEAAEKKFKDNLLAKRNAHSLGTGPSNNNVAPDKELEDTEKSGGLTNVLLSRLGRFRSGQQ